MKLWGEEIAYYQPHKGPENGCRVKIVEKFRKLFLTLSDDFSPLKNVKN